MILFLLLLSLRASACGPWGCYTETCLVYGDRTSTAYNSDVCSQREVAHVDQNNWTETNYAMLARDLTESKAHRKFIDVYVPYDDSEKPTPPPLTGDEYQNGIQLFRSQKFDDAIVHFRKVTGADSAKAAYYIARSHLRSSQKNFDGFQRAGVLADEAKLARDAFRAFAADNTQHEWATSARGLIRYAEVLAGDWDGYVSDWSAEVDRELARKPRYFEAVDNLLKETRSMDLKTLVSLKHLHPVMWLVRSYYVTRDWYDTKQVTEPFDAADQLKTLEADSAAFKNHPDLYAWSRAVLLLKLGRAQAGYELIENQSGGLSLAILKARLLMGLKKFDEARAQVEPFIRANPLAIQMPPKGSEDTTPSYYSSSYNIAPTWDLTDDSTAFDVRNFYAMTFFWEGHAEKIATRKTLDLISRAPFERVFIQGSTPDAMIEVLRNVKLDSQVRAYLEPLVIAKLVVINDWSKAAELRLLAPESKVTVGGLQKAAATLTQKPDDAAANATIGLYLASVKPGYRVFTPCTNQKFSDVTAPMEFYLKSLASFKSEEAAKKPANPLEAKLLAGMLTCFKPHYGTPVCGKGSFAYSERAATITERGAWWRRLRKRFPDSPEAKKLTVFW